MFANDTSNQLWIFNLKFGVFANKRNLYEDNKSAHIKYIFQLIYKNTSIFDKQLKKYFRNCSLKLLNFIKIKAKLHFQTSRNRL